MMQADPDDTHLCIKCSTTIVGLDNYIQHRKLGCGGTNTQTKLPASSTRGSASQTHEVPSPIIPIASTSLNRSYDPFPFHEQEAPSSYVCKSENGDKASKSMGDSYDLTYELGADVFFSSLQLQSVQTIGPTASSGGKTGPTQTGQPYGSMFKRLIFSHDSPEISDDDGVNIDDEDDEDFAAHASGGKWKYAEEGNSSPAISMQHHSDGLWKSGHRSNIQTTHPQSPCLPPNWDEQMDEPEIVIEQHPPADHTKGKWVPGSKVTRPHLEYKEVQLIKRGKQEYWCKICSRKLGNKVNYERHLRTKFHRKRSEPEEQLSQVTVGQLPQDILCKSFLVPEELRAKMEMGGTSKKRKRRAVYFKCELCKHTVVRHLVGKHLISHFHYRRMQVNPSKCLPTILEHMHSIVVQSPFQCRACCFYANTEEAFLRHWNSASHLDATEGPGRFCCSYCQFECEDNNQMRRHLVSNDHKEVILAINRSVPISISKLVNIKCLVCGELFRYNAELRLHYLLRHPEAEDMGTAADSYQNHFRCSLCDEVVRSKVALQRHKKFKHRISNYFCTTCELEFNTALLARRHRKTMEHRNCSRKPSAKPKKSQISKRALLKEEKKNCLKCSFVPASSVEAMLHDITAHMENDYADGLASEPNKRKHTPNCGKTHLVKTKSKISLKCKDCKDVFKTRDELKTHRDTKHPLLSHICMSCGQSFAMAQALGRHTRICQPTPSTSKAAAAYGKIGKELKWTCDQCSFSAPYESELMYHRLFHTYGTITKNQMIKCPLCPKLFRKHSLRCHLRQHTNEKIFECPLCELKFARQHNMKDHIRLMHGGALKSQPPTKDAKKLYECETCNKSFSSKYSLKMHKKTHENSPELKFRCPHEGCQFNALSRSRLQIHMASHSQEAFKCEFDGCYYIGKSWLHLKRHSKTHSPPTNVLQCNKCEFQANVKAHMDRHMRSHSGEKPHKCPHCSFRCNTLDNLRKHILKTKKHTGKFIYECQMCREQHQKEDRLLEALKMERVNEVFKTNSKLEYDLHMTEHSKKQKLEHKQD